MVYLLLLCKAGIEGILICFPIVGGHVLFGGDVDNTMTLAQGVICGVLLLRFMETCAMVTKQAEGRGKT